MRKIVLAPPFRPDGGFAYICDVPEGEALAGDSPEASKQSPVALLENEVPVGPGHVHHYLIREQGRGRYSHWHNTLHFSASDNTDPNSNGRSYALAIPADDELAFHRRTMLEGIGGNPSLIFAVLRAAQNTNGSPLALYITGFGNYRALMQRAGIDLRDKVVLEIGAGPHPGTALAFLLHGAKKVVVNDIGKVAQVVSRDYARIIQLFAKVVTSRDTVPLDAVTEPAGGNEDNLTFSQDRFQAIPHTGAEVIGLPDESVDMIVSTSVLEHVMKPREVLANTFRLLKPGGWCLHGIDLRDHANPLEPLRFLEKPREVYEPGGTENRVRALDFIRFLRELGYDIRHVEFHDDPVSVDEFGNIDGMAYLLTDRDERSPHRYGSLESIVPWVTEAARQKLDPEFRSRSLQELSVLGLNIVARKPG